MGLIILFANAQSVAYGETAVVQRGPLLPSCYPSFNSFVTFHRIITVPVFKTKHLLTPVRTYPRQAEWNNSKHIYKTSMCVCLYI